MVHQALSPPFSQGKQLFDHSFSALEHPLIESVQTLLSVSPYACRQQKILQDLIREDNCLQPLSMTTYQALMAEIPLDKPAPAFSKLLRQFRHRHILRLMLRSLAQQETQEATMRAWSECADVLILRSLAYCEQQQANIYGTPCPASGETSELFVIAMGKLGGFELNFSSDIDLIFGYSESGDTKGGRSVSHEQYYTKIVQQFIQIMQQVTADGFVFRVDLRLRPNGGSGPLVYSLSAMESYYQEQGRDWERYAMVKARLIGVPSETAHPFKLLITPFVYRRYVDFTVIESLRSMKTMIERELKLDPLSKDIKRGWGGIREIEFILQSFQLIRGGRLAELQRQNAMEILEILGQQGLLNRTGALKQAYLFLRQLENILQVHNDQQTHALPTDPLIQAQIATAMNYPDWASLRTKLVQYRRIVNTMFHAILGKADLYEDEKRLCAHQLFNLWQGHVEHKMAVHFFMSLGFQEAERCYQMLTAFRNSPRCRRLTQAARIRLDRFVVLLLNELAGLPKTDQILLQVLRLLEAIVARSAYLALLAENPHVLQELLHWFQHSPFITGLIVQHPFLLEVLVDQGHAWRPFNRTQLQNDLHARLRHARDNEQQHDALRQFKLTCWLLAARAELYGQCHAVRTAAFLADTAEVILNAVVEIACAQLSARYPEIVQVKAQFGLIAYGKLGSREMNYDSDVDLVFLHTVSPLKEAFVTRLTQKILHMLTSRSQTGVLYPVDTRLRPSGSAGLLVSHMDAFAAYQNNQAWTWEHQALMRARVLFGARSIRSQFLTLKKNVLSKPRTRLALRDEFLAMRAKIHQQMTQETVKHTAGGLLDLEFLIQFLVLAYPKESFARCPNLLSQLKQLFNNQVLTPDQYARLKKAYRQYHQQLHGNLLQPQAETPITEPADVIAIRKQFSL